MRTCVVAKQLRIAMKNRARIATFAALLLSIGSCRPTAPVKPAVDSDPMFNTPYFSQVNTAFRGSQTAKLLNFWYGGRSAEPVEFAVVNDQRTYQAFFGQASADSLPYIDFNRYTLLIGNRGGYGSFVNGPANITSIQQTLEKQSNGQFTFTVVVSARSKGQEWFGFTSLVPGVDTPEDVKLTMQYRFE